MQKVSCPNCSSMKVTVTDHKEENHVFEEKTEFIMGRRAVPKKKKVLVSYQRTIEYKCKKCGEIFTHTERVNNT